MESQALDMEKRFLILSASENLYFDELLLIILIFSFFMNFAFLPIAVVASRRRRRVGRRRCVGRVGRVAVLPTFKKSKLRNRASCAIFEF